MEKRTVTNLLLGVMICGMALGAGAGIALNWKNITSTVNGWAGDKEKVTFTQIIKKANYAYVDPKNETVLNGTLSGGVFKIDNSTGTAAAHIYKNGSGSYSGQYLYFEKGSHDLNGYAIYYVSSAAKCATISSSSIHGLSVKGINHNFALKKSAVWQKDSYSLVNTTGYFDYAFSGGLICGANNTLELTDFQIVNISSLGIWDTTEATSVWESLTKGDYFEGDKVFTKGEIKKAIADYEAEQAKTAAAASSAATSSAAA